jgi:hypothetical protein
VKRRTTSFLPSTDPCRATERLPAARPTAITNPPRAPTAGKRIRRRRDGRTPERPNRPMSNFTLLTRFRT